MPSQKPSKEPITAIMREKLHLIKSTASGLLCYETDAADPILAKLIQHELVKRELFSGQQYWVPTDKGKRTLKGPRPGSQDERLF